ncbi:hypothetical protein D9M73_187290 [compost metagenome]
MERIALHVQPRNRRIQEAQVEAAVMPDQDRPFATVGLEGLAHAAEDIVQGRLFTHRHAQRVIELDPGEFQGCRFDVRAFERLDTEKVGVIRVNKTLFIHGDGGRGDFQQGVGGGVEATGFYVDDNRQVTTEPCGHWLTGTATAAIAFQFVVEMVFTHACSSSRRQRSFSPARSGITVSSPNGRLVGAVHSSRTRVMRSVLAGRP